MTIQRMSLTACCLLVFFSIIIGCQKEDETQTLQNTITITAKEAFDVSASATSVEAEIAVQGSISIAEKGVCWNTQSSPTINNNVTKEGTGSSSIKGSITGLQPATTYYVRAYCTDDKGQTTYSNEINFTTLTNVPALAITTGSATSVTATTASVTGSLSGTGTVTARGVCWSTSQNPTTNNSKTNNGTGTGNFTAALTGLTSGTTYYVRAYATTSTGTTYGNEVSFIAQTTTAPALTITTGSATSVTATTASVSGSIGGTGTVTTRGICWSTSQNPTTNNSKTNDGAGTGNFTAALTGLTAGTAYYVRAYATTSSGTTYGNEVSFTTLTTSAPALTITTGSAASITATTASVTGSIGGTGTVTARGICWSTSQNPTTNNSKTNNGTGTGNFTAALTSLTAGTTYYVRAYATTSTGTTYGNQISFSTLDNTLSVVTGNASIIGYVVTIKCTTSGAATILSQGVVYGKSQSPTINNSKAVSGQTFTGIHSLIIAQLDYCTKYYARAFATVAGGTTIYGNEVTFRSPGNPLNDCHPFNGLWGTSATNPDVVYKGNVSHFAFYSMVPQSTNSNTWDNARRKGFIGIGNTDYIKDIVVVNANTWKCTSLWRNGTASGVTEVKYSSNSTMVLSADEKIITLTSLSPFTNNTSSVTLYKQQ